MTQLAYITLYSVLDSANVLQLTHIEDRKLSGRYKLLGVAYYTDRYEQLKAKMNEKKKKLFDTTSEACLTIYRPAYSLGFNDSIKYDVVINDSLKLPMQANTKYILKITNEKDIKITVRHKDFIQDMKIHVQVGKKYYVRNYANFPGAHKYITTGEFKVKLRGYTPYLEKIDDELQGEIESSMVTQITVTKKL